MTTQSSLTLSGMAAATVAPEDVTRGDYVAVLNEVVECPSFLWCESLGESTADIVRLRFTPDEEGVPLKVRAVCLPFVFVQTPWKRHRTLDVRKVQLARLTKRYARFVAKTLRQQKTTAP